MKVYIGTDLEGDAGVSTFYVQTSPEGKYYEAAKKLLTAATAAGAERIDSQTVVFRSNDICKIIY